MAIDKCVENFFDAVLKNLLASIPKCRPRDDPRPSIPASIQDKIRMKKRLRSHWQDSIDPAVKAEVNILQRTVTFRLKEWWNDQWGATLEFLDPEDLSLLRMIKQAMRVPKPSPHLVIAGGIALSDFKKAKILADSLETQFQPVTDPLVPAIIELVDVALKSYSITPATQPK
jgi:hypothetical protein